MNDWIDYPTGKIAKGAFCQSCKRFNERVIVGHALVIKNNQVLLIKRGIEPMKGWWALPAGYLDWDETVEENTLRELEEETRVRGEIVRLFGVYSDPKRDEDKRQNVAIVYLVESKGEIKAGGESEAVQWFDLNKLPKLAFDHKKIISDYVRRKNHH